jgi:hypothetical protein
MREESELESLDINVFDGFASYPIGSSLEL